MRPGHAKPGPQYFADPRIDIRGGHAERFARRGNVSLHHLVGLIARKLHLVGGVTGKFPSADAMIFLVEPSRADGRAVEPFVERILEHVVDKPQHRIGGKHARFRNAPLQVMNHRGRIPHEFAARRHHDRHRAGPSSVARRAISAGESPQQIRNGFVVEIAGKFAREVGLAHPIHAIARGARSSIKRHDCFQLGDACIGTMSAILSRRGQAGAIRSDRIGPEGLSAMAHGEFCPLTILLDL